MPVNVLLVDDSAIIRGLMTKALSADPELAIIGSAANGRMAIEMAREHQPDVIILDIEMPEMDGITALPEILKAAPKSKVIMASTLTKRNATITFKALELGASDSLAKPNTGEAEGFFRELLDKVRALGGLSNLSPKVEEVVAPAPKLVEAPREVAPALPGQFKALAIASSTGGPQALLSLFTQLQGRLQGVPIFITQHMPPTFTTILADHLRDTGKRPCVEAKDNELVQPGHVYVAPGDFHMVAEKNAAGQIHVRINQGERENFCRPAADPMLRSLSRIYGNHLMVVVLTGMGQDGLEGSREVVSRGGTVIAQNEASCVVYGMPKAVVENNLCKAVLPLDGMGSFLIRQIDML